ncbi:MAG: DnaA regulatory inactivator Hda [Gammaproteobacteria bacterium]|nr:MAG: DnaA regulatory inactivator Hda [Gammaproteobacteria bacterium]
MNSGADSARQIALPFAWIRRFDFAAYIAGRNHAAVAALKALSLGEGGGNIYLWGRAGTGKSHLLHAVCGAASARQKNAGYIPLRQIRELSPDLLQGLDSLDLVCLDDLDQLAGKPDWERELFHLFNRMREAGKALVFASRLGPREISIELPDLKTRLAWDLGFLLEPPDDETLIRALRERAAERGLDLPEEIAQYIMTRCARDTHSLFRLLERLDETALERQKRLTIPLLRELLDRGYDPDARKIP